MNDEQKKLILENSGFKCLKCGYYSPLGKNLNVIPVHNIVLCDICKTFSPEDKEDFEKYISEKLEWQILETFRNSGVNKSTHNSQKLGMIEKSKIGKLMARPPFGYKVENGELIEDMENSENVRLIFKEFAEGKSLNQIAKIYGISVNGIKKILKNFTYLGKIKFAGQIAQGNHQALIPAELFNRVQQRFEGKKEKLY